MDDNRRKVIIAASIGAISPLSTNHVIAALHSKDIIAVVIHMTKELNEATENFTQQLKDITIATENFNKAIAELKAIQLPYKEKKKENKPFYYDLLNKKSKKK